jgi:coenzyme F420-reducing hydrogenase delta subunit
VKCQKVIDETLQIMQLLGIDERRLRLKWISASEGGIFAEQIRAFTQLLRELGAPAVAGLPPREAPPVAVAAATTELPKMASA